jgi:prepilin-type N-terminal cleavage/methylation domain-containing protein
MTTTRRSGFTLIEVATVAVVMGILAGIAVPNLTDAIRKADAATIVSDSRLVDMAVQSYMQTNGRLPSGARWNTVPPSLTEYLPENMSFSHKQLDYRLRVNRRRGRVRFEVRYPRNDAIGEALKHYRRTGKVAWTRRRTTFILDS